MVSRSTKIAPKGGMVLSKSPTAMRTGVVGRYPLICGANPRGWVVAGSQPFVFGVIIITIVLHGFTSRNHPALGNNLKPDCYLRQGEGGTKTARFGSKTCFLR